MCGRTHLGESGPPTGKWRWSRETFPVSGRTTVEVQGRQQEVYVDVHFRIAQSRYGGKTRLLLHIDDIDFGVNNCFDERTKRGNFVYKVTIDAIPGEEWSEHCTRVLSKPSHDPNVIKIKNFKSTGVNVQLMHLEQTAVSSTQGQAISRYVKTCGWTPAVQNSKSKSVRWTWTLNTWENGASFEADKPAKATTDGLPELPFNPSSLRYDENSFAAGASWELPTENAKRWKTINWTVKITMHVAFVGHVKALKVFGVLGDVLQPKPKIETPIEFSTEVEFAHRSFTTTLQQVTFSFFAQI